MFETILKLIGLILQIIGVMTVTSTVAFFVLMWMSGRGRDE